MFKRLKKLCVLIPLVCALVVPLSIISTDAEAQCGGQFAPGAVCGNSTANPALPSGGPSGFLAAINGYYAYPYGTSNPTGIASGNVIPTLNQNTQWTQNGVYPTTWVATNPYSVGNGTYSCIGTLVGTVCTGAVTSSDTYALTFTSSNLTGSPIVISYTATNVDTPATVATNLCNLVLANTTLVNATTGLPILCDASFGGGAFNVQWSVNIQPITVTSTGTGTISLINNSNKNTLDGVVYRWLHQPGGSYTAVAPEQDICFQFFGPAVASETMFCSWYTSSSSGGSSELRFYSFTTGTLNEELDIGNGLTAASLTPQGVGSVNMLAALGYYLGNVQALYASSGYAVVNGTNGVYLAVAGTLEAVLTSSVFTPQNDNTLSLGQSSDRWANIHTLAATFYGASSGNTKVQASATASGTLTLPAATDQLVGRATTDTLTNKTINGSNNTLTVLASSQLSGATPYANGGTNATSLAGAQANFEQSEVRVQATGVNFNSVADTALAFTLPTGYTRVFVQAVTISNASHTLTTATFGVFTATGGGGQSFISTGTSISVSATTDQTANNMQQTNGGLTMSAVAASLTTPNTIYFRVTNPEGVAATGDITAELRFTP